ncbi:hypothetical protein ASG43_12830 [Aureimonas sp. Leaf454]|uniref:flagellar hook-associated protein FlgK n=1 Tax=Aureimonas sp. Leaf454 TaxID=1736381 RepID=UPI0006FB7185|nr:flagellar hook-associated protein FlgK [Aureimonas sp. Leaf454]KQT45172.1 hypothetical protein ASG43_12830 [Aureimonas sp. Leaf454]
MSLSTALDTAKSSLAATQAQTAILSRNIANVNVVGATKKYANVVTSAGGGVKITSITQSSNAILYGNMLEAKAAVGRGNVIANGLDRLNETMGDTTLGRSPSAMVTKLSDALNTLAASPNNFELARNAANAATDLATTLNSASDTVQTIRRDADKELVNAASEMTRILAKIEDLNKRVVSGSQSGADITDLNDQRDLAIGELSQYVAVTVRTRGNDDVVLYTDSGVTLFETSARTIEFTASPGLNATIATGGAFRIDGIPVTGDTAYMPLKGGSVAGLVALRDEIMPTYQTQLDEIARGLIDATKETGSGQGYLTGLFTSGSPTSLEALKTTSSMSLGTVARGTLAVGDTLSFDISYDGKTYRATKTFAAADFDAATFGVTASNTFAEQLQTMIAGATLVGSSPATTLGAGKIKVQDLSGALTLSATSLGSSVPVSIGNIVGVTPPATTADPDKDGGLVAGATIAVKAPVIAGLAASLQIAAGVAINPQLLRDGVNSAISGFKYNAADAGGYAGRLNQLFDGLAARRSFAEGTGADPTGSVADYAASSISWLQAFRQTALAETEYKTTFLQNTETALSNATGVNMDEQLTHLTEIQRSYQASAKLISTIDEMLKTLLASI